MKATEIQKAIWAKGETLYDDFLEYLSYMHDPNARKIARTPRTNTLEAFASAKTRKKLNALMLAEYQSNTCPKEIEELKMGWGIDKLTDKINELVKAVNKMKKGGVR